MKAKTVLIEQEKPYSEKELAKIKKILKKAEAARKDPNFRKFVQEFIDYHTGSK